MREEPIPLTLQCSRSGRKFHERERHAKVEAVCKDVEKALVGLGSESWSSLGGVQQWSHNLDAVLKESMEGEGSARSGDEIHAQIR